MHMIKKFFARIKNIWLLPEAYAAQFRTLHAVVDRLEQRLGEHTIVHSDVHTKKPSQVIVVGRYRNSDYVRVFDLDAQTWTELVDMLRKIEPRSQVGRFDLYPGTDISVVYPHDRL